MSRYAVLFVLLPTPLLAEPTEVIHILNWHYMSERNFASDLRVQDKTITNEQIKKRYKRFLDDVEAVQKQQMELLMELIKKHKIQGVYIEGLTEKGELKEKEYIEKIKRYVQNNNNPPDSYEAFLLRREKIKIGAAGRLVIKDELKALLPAEDSKAFKAANPFLPDGKVKFNEKANEAREDAIVRNLLKGEGVVVITLGGGHDLSDNMKRLAKGMKYTRVAVPKYKEIKAR